MSDSARDLVLSGSNVQLFVGTKVDWNLFETIGPVLMALIYPPHGRQSKITASSPTSGTFVSEPLSEEVTHYIQYTIYTGTNIYTGIDAVISSENKT